MPGRITMARDATPPIAEFFGAVDRRRHARRGGGDSCRNDFELSRPRHSAPHTQLGEFTHPCGDEYFSRTVAGLSAGAVYFLCADQFQSARRRAARCLGSAPCRTRQVSGGWFDGSGPTELRSSVRLGRKTISTRRSSAEI